MGSFEGFGDRLNPSLWVSLGSVSFGSPLEWSLSGLDRFRSLFGSDRFRIFSAQAKAHSSAMRSCLAFDSVWSRAANRADRLGTLSGGRGRGSAPSSARVASVSCFSFNKKF